MTFPAQAKELIKLLEEDQREKRVLGRIYFESDNGEYEVYVKKIKNKKRSRTEKMLEVLHHIKEPTISNIGIEGSKAISILALHDSLEILEEVTKAFTDLFKSAPDDVYYQAIPAMVDRVLILQDKPQRFATQWLFDENKYPFLPIVEDFKNVNKRRLEYGLEPLDWPKSLAIPKSRQPWLKRPLSEAIIRDLTKNERDSLENI